MPVAILLLALLLDPGRLRTATDGCTQLEPLWMYGPVTFVLASMVVISPWELPVGAMVTFLLLQRDLPLRPLFSWDRIRLGSTVVLMLVAGYVLYLPFYLHFAAPPGGVGYKFARTSLIEFLTVFGALLLPAALYLGSIAVPRIPLKKEHA